MNPKTLAHQMLAHTGERVPVRTVNLARCLGFKVTNGCHDPNLAGSLNIPQRVIAVNAADSPLRQRFVIAVAVGRILQEDPNSSEVIEFPRIFPKEDPKAMFAFEFAKNVLMPENALRFLWGEFFFHTLEETAAYFKVSESTMANRVIELGMG